MTRPLEVRRYPSTSCCFCWDSTRTACLTGDRSGAGVRRRRIWREVESPADHRAQDVRGYGPQCNGYLSLSGMRDFVANQIWVHRSGHLLVHIAESGARAAAGNLVHVPLGANVASNYPPIICRYTTTHRTGLLSTSHLVWTEFWRIAGSSRA